MKNYINHILVAQREIGDVEVAELNCLHYLAECIVGRVLHELEDGKPHLSSQIADAFEAMKFVEYEMQKRWGFSLSERHHTHKARLQRIIGEERWPQSV